MKKRERVRNVEETDITSPNQFRRDESRELHRPSFETKITNDRLWYHSAINRLSIDITPLSKKWNEGKSQRFSEYFAAAEKRRGQTLDPEKMRRDERLHRRRRIRAGRNEYNEMHPT